MIEIEANKNVAVSVAGEIGQCTIVGDRQMADYILELVRIDQKKNEYKRIHSQRQSSDSFFLIPPAFFVPIFPRSTRTAEIHQLKKSINGFSLSVHSTDRSNLPIGIIPRRTFLHFMNTAIKSQKNVINYGSHSSLMRIIKQGLTGQRIKILQAVLKKFQRLHLTISENHSTLFDGPIFESVCTGSCKVVFTKKFCETFLWNQPLNRLIAIEKELVFSATGALLSDCLLLFRYLQNTEGDDPSIKFPTHALWELFAEPQVVKKHLIHSLRKHGLKQVAKLLPSNGDNPALKRSGQNHILSRIQDSDNLNAGFDFLLPQHFLKKSSVKSMPENELRKIVERLTNEEFPSVRPDWLINPPTGRKLELDLYNEELSLAFEYQGYQHYESVSAWGGSDRLKEIRERDLTKERICKEEGVSLHAIDGRIFGLHNLDQMEEHVRKILDIQTR